jgi:hypothetical protein
MRRIRPLAALVAGVTRRSWWVRRPWCGVGFDGPKSPDLYERMAYSWVDTPPDLIYGNRRSKARERLRGRRSKMGRIEPKQGSSMHPELSDLTGVHLA